MTNDNETERARSALFTISPDLPHDQWVRVGMAAHAGGLSFDEWNGWSQRGSNYNPTTARDAWRSFSDKPGGVTVATHDAGMASAAVSLGLDVFDPVV